MKRTVLPGASRAPASRAPASLAGAFLASAFLAIALTLGTAARADDPMTVTSDTREYCLALAERIGAHGTLTPFARVLWEHGRRMCQQDQVREGLNRLRRAMLLTRDGPE